MVAGLRKYVRYRSVGAVFLAVVGVVAAGGPTAAQAEDKWAAGQATFKENCVLCHGDNGAGTPLGNSLKIKDLRSKEVQDKTSEALAQTVHDGKNNMPPFKTRLSDEQIHGVIEYIRHLGQASH